MRDERWRQRVLWEAENEGKESLHGWDDEKVYYWDGKKEWCISDEEILVRMIKRLCRDYFKEFKERRTKENEFFGIRR